MLGQYLCISGTLVFGALLYTVHHSHTGAKPRGVCVLACVSMPVQRLLVDTQKDRWSCIRKRNMVNGLQS